MIIEEDIVLSSSDRRWQYNQQYRLCSTSKDKIKELIKKISKEKIVIFSTHILSEVEAIANRLIIINAGKIVYDDVKPKGTGAVEKLFKKLLSA